MSNSKDTTKKKSYIFGVLSENIAKLYLTICFYKIIHSRYKAKLGEIDIIAKKGNMIVFIEVKGRKNQQNIHYTVNDCQKNRIINASKFFLMKNKKYNNCNFRYDVFLFSPPFFIKYIKNAFGA